MEQSKRIQTSILNAAEKKALVYMAGKMPKWVDSDMLTFVGFVGAILCGAGFVLSNLSIQWLWLANFGLLVNWFGDSLDGTLARVRNQQRPIYGYYLDHTTDCIEELFIFCGAGLSAMTQNFYLAVAGLILYELLTINVCINAHLKSEFKLTYAKMGPTEFRLVVFLCNLIFIFVRPVREFLHTVTVFGHDFLLGPFDCAAIVILVILILVYTTTVFGDLKEYDRMDPKPKAKE